MSTTVTSTTTPSAYAKHRKSAVDRLNEANAAARAPKHRKITGHARKVPFVQQPQSANPFQLATMLRSTGTTVDVYA